ncbi:hypothetical protein U8M77_28050, partial [Klebsiella pneumoniae]
VDQGDQARTTAACQIERLREMRKVTIDAQQFVAPRQALSGGIHQHHDRSLWMCAGAGKHGFGQCQCVVHADFKLVGGTD